MRCVAVISVRNGIDYIEKCIQHLFENKIEVAIIDQSSDDGTYEYCQKFKGEGLVALKRVDYPGYFSLKDQLQEKYKLIDKIQSDWIIHQDVDEKLLAPKQNINLYESIKGEDEKSFNVINFNEFVFLPCDESISFDNNLYYYFFEPFSPRLMRAWKKNDGLDGLQSGGHILQGNARISPENYSLLHYIFVSQQHAYDKYSKREFEEKETAQGWHKNRLDIKQNQLTFPDKSQLNIWSDEMDFRPDVTNPWKKHYWE